MENIWAENDEDITDASNADDYLVEAAIREFQYSVKTITDMAVSLSSSKRDLVEKLSSYQDCVHEAYVALLDKKYKEATNILKKVVNK